MSTPNPGVGAVELSIVVQVECRQSKSVTDTDISFVRLGILLTSTVVCDSPSRVARADV